MGDEREFCTFFLDAHYFGVDVLKVQEVIRYQEMTRVPLVPRVIRDDNRYNPALRDAPPAAPKA